MLFEADKDNKEYVKRPDFIDKDYIKIPDFLKEINNSFVNSFSSFSIFNDINRINLIEEKDCYRIEMIAIGLNKENINIETEGFKIIIEINKETTKEEKKYLIKQFEYGEGKTQKIIEIPSKDIDLENIKASLKDGILTITINKVDKPIKKIEII